NRCSIGSCGECSRADTAPCRDPSMPSRRRPGFGGWSSVPGSPPPPNASERTHMRIARCLGIIFGLTLAVAAARAQEVTVVRDVLGPEGPLFVDGHLYFVAWTTGSLSKWDGKATT